MHQIDLPVRETSPLSPSSERWLLGLVTLTVLMVTASETILNIALPIVARDLGASTAQSTWLLLVPSLVSSCLLILFGRIADLFGRRTMFLSGLAAYAFSCAAMGFAPSAPVLLMWLGLQAVAAAMLLCNTGAVVASVFRGARLNLAMGIYLAGVSVAGMLGPAIGGIIADNFGWRWIFWCQVPVAIVCLTLGAVLLGRLARPAPASTSLDLPGALSVTVALVFLLVGISFIQSEGISSWQAIVGLLGALATIPLVMFVESRATNPILPLSLFKDVSFRRANIANLLSVMPRFTSAVIIGLYFQVVSGDPPALAGMKLIPLPLGITLGSLLADAVVVRLGQRRAAIVSLIIVSAALPALLLTLVLHLPYALVAGALLVLGIGLGTFATVNSAMVIGKALPREVGIVNGVRLTGLNIGGTIATASGLVLVTSALPIPLRVRFYEASLDGSQYADALNQGFIQAFAAMMVVTLLTTVITIRTRNPSAC